MKKNSPIFLIIALCVVAFVIVIVIATTGSRTGPGAEAHFKIPLMTTTLGGMIALFAAAMLLVRAAAGAGLRGLIPLTIPLLAGVLIASFHWSAALALGAIGITLLVRQMVGTPGERRGGQEKASISATETPER